MASYSLHLFRSLSQQLTWIITKLYKNLHDGDNRYNVIRSITKNVQIKYLKIHESDPQATQPQTVAFRGKQPED
jgi:hypothetical protein